jgi:YVTN family beta-propeller protein
VAVGTDPVGAVIAPNGATAYVTNAGADTVSVIDTVTNSLSATVKVGWRPVDAVVTPDGGAVYVTNTGSNNVSVISTITNTVVATLSVGDDFPAHVCRDFLDRYRRSRPVHVTVSPDGTRAYVTNAGAESVSVIDATANPPKVVATVGVGSIPVHVTISPDGAIEASTNAVSATVPVGVLPVDAAIF